jgi:hypothetical protein
MPHSPVKSLLVCRQTPMQDREKTGLFYHKTPGSAKIFAIDKGWRGTI